MLRSAEKALRSSREVVCCSKQPPAPRWDAASLARCCEAEGVAGKTPRKGPSCTTDGLTDYLAGWLAGWLTERQLKCSQDRQVEVVMVTVTGGAGAELLFSSLLSSVSSYNSSCPSSSSPSDSTSSRSSKSWRKEEEKGHSLARNLSNVLSMQSSTSTVRIDLHSRA